ncbi:hypothetical protein [Amycolatopsis magusensis]|uniref:hypothetical protein n=1 Tax=Amycolatopsis magusensis TaxID=882444 RepID=UPI003799AEDA
MAATITATYTPDNDDWTVTVSGLEGEPLTGRAPGIIAARDRADQLVEKLAGGEKATVVHLLNGSAFEFTHAYMSARLTRSEETPKETAREAKSELQEAIDDPAAGVFTDIGEAIGTQRTETGDASEELEAKPPVARA